MIFPASTLGRNARSVIGLKRSAAARMSLPLQLRKWASHRMRYAVRLTELGHTGHSRLAQKRRHDGDEHQDGCASMREDPVRSSLGKWRAVALVADRAAKRELGDHY